MMKMILKSKVESDGNPNAQLHFIEDVPPVGGVMPPNLILAIPPATVTQYKVGKAYEVTIAEIETA